MITLLVKLPMAEYILVLIVNFLAGC